MISPRLRRGTLSILIPVLFDEGMPNERGNMQFNRSSKKYIAFNCCTYPISHLKVSTYSQDLELPKHKKNPSYSCKLCHIEVRPNIHPIYIRQALSNGTFLLQHAMITYAMTFSPKLTTGEAWWDVLTRRAGLASGSTEPCACDMTAHNNDVRVTDV